MKKYTITLTIIFILLATLSLGASEAQAVIRLGSSNAVTQGSGLVGYWPLDGAVTNWATGQTRDLSGNGNTGSLAGLSTTTSPVAGKVGQALTFDNVDDAVDMGVTPSSLNITGDLTISAWIKPNSFGGGSRGRIVDNGGTGADGYVFYVDNSAVSNGLSFFPATGPIVSNPNTITTGRWQHVVVSYSGTTVTFYVNGVAAGSGTGNPPTSSSVNFLIGARAGATDRQFDGTIDDVRVYNRALSANDVKQLYSSGAANAGHSNTVAVSNGLVGYWPLDGSATNWTTNTTRDISGNGNTGSLIGLSTTTSPVAGKVGQALSFNGSSSYISLGTDAPFNSDANANTVTAWFKTTSTGVIISDNNGVPPSGTSGYDPLLYVETNGLLHGGGYAGGFPALESSGAVNDGNWHLAALTYDGSNVQTLYLDGSQVATQTGTRGGIVGPNYWIIGTGFSGGGWPNTNNDWFYFNGTIDDARIYNRALSATDIKQLYAVGAAKVGQSSVSTGDGLVGYWPFDGSATNWTTNTTRDISGNSNTGSLISFSTSTSPVAGKVGQALDFNNTSTYVNVTTGSSLQLSGAMSMCAWINPRSVIDGDGNSDVIVAQLSAIGESPYALALSGGNEVSTAWTSDGPGGVESWETTDNAIVLNAWQHVCVSRATADSVTLYVNGVAHPTQNVGNVAITTASGTVDIGAAGLFAANYVDGKLDEVRIYNRALSATEVRQLYNSGR